MMIDLMKRMLYTGVGLASLTREKIEEVAKEVARHADLTESQAKQFQEDLVRKGEEARTQLETEIDHRVEQALTRIGVARREQVESLTQRVAALEERLAREPTLPMTP